MEINTDGVTKLSYDNNQNMSRRVVPLGTEKRKWCPEKQYSLSASVGLVSHACVFVYVSMCVRERTLTRPNTHLCNTGAKTKISFMADLPLCVSFSCVSSSFVCDLVTSVRTFSSFAKIHTATFPCLAVTG